MKRLTGWLNAETQFFAYTVTSQGAWDRMPEKRKCPDKFCVVSNERYMELADGYAGMTNHQWLRRLQRWEFGGEIQRQDKTGKLALFV